MQLITLFVPLGEWRSHTKHAGCVIPVLIINMSIWLYNNILTFILSFVLVGIVIPQILRIAFHKKLFDSHDGRKVHVGNIPRLGGVAFVPGIVFGVLLSLGICAQMSGFVTDMVFYQGLVPVCFLTCSLLLLFLIGVVDDLVGVSYKAKFVFQILCGIFTLASGVCVNNLNGFLYIWGLPDWVGWPLTILLIVYVINSLNLIDGIDGLAAGLATITLAYFAWAYYDAGEYILSMIACGGIGALLPFLYFNIFGNPDNNRKIFMGDTGALTIGMVIAYLAVGFTQTREYGNVFSGVNPDVIAFSPLMIPLFDQLRVFYHRISRRRNPFMPDRCHIHHKLLALGLTARQTLLAIISVTLVLVVLNWVMSRYMNVNSVILIDFLIWLLVNMMLTKGIRRIENETGERLYD